MKKFICLLLACTLVFSLCACGKEKTQSEKSDRDNYNENISIDNTEEETTETVVDSDIDTEEETLHIYTTDRDNDGRIVFYITDEDGQLVTAQNGIPETGKRPFEPVSRENSIEYYGYKVELPEGWVLSGDPNRFVNEKLGYIATVTPLDSDYDSYYNQQRSMYDLLVSEYPDDVSWTEDVSIGEGCTGVVRFTLRTDTQMNIMYFFENSGNLYKILFESENTDTILSDSMVFCRAITYMPYQYFNNN